MKGLEKITFIRLAEVLSQKQVVNTEVITDALYTQDQYGEPFVDILVGGGSITEWDLAKVVVEHFQLPFMMAGSYQLSDAAKSAIPEEDLFKNMLVPLDRFDKVLTVSMPILTPFEAIDKLQKAHGLELFPYVGLISENKKLLGDNYEGFKGWWDREQKRRETKEARPAGAGKSGGGGDDWMNIFDTGDAAVLDGLGDKPAE